MINPNDKVEFPNLPQIYPSNSYPLSNYFPSPPKKKHKKSTKNEKREHHMLISELPEIIKNQNPVHGFFQNMVESLNNPNAKYIPPIKKAKVPVYDPSQPLITSDIYVAKPLKFKSTLENEVQEVRNILVQVSTNYRQAIVYKKPKLLPLLQVPEFKGREYKRGAGRNKNIMAIEDDELIDYVGDYIPDYSMKPKITVGTKKSKQIIESKSGIVETQAPDQKEKYRSQKDLSWAYREFRAIVEIIKFGNYLFRLYSHQIKDMADPVKQYLKEHYQSAMKEITRVGSEICASQLVRVWQAIATDSNLNIVINKQILFSYGMLDQDDIKKPYTAAEMKRNLEGSQPFSDSVHVCFD